MFKKKDFSILWLVIGLLLCLLPLLIYLIVYAAESDKMVQIYLANPATAPTVAPPAYGQVSPDGHWQWNGAQWVPVQALPAPASEPAAADEAPVAVEEPPAPE